MLAGKKMGVEEGFEKGRVMATAHDVKIIVDKMNRSFEKPWIS